MPHSPRELHLRPVQISPDVLFQEVAGEAVLLNLASEQYFGLDEVGTRIWNLIQQGTPLVDIASILGGEYDAPMDAIAKDLDELLDNLANAGLIILG